MATIKELKKELKSRGLEYPKSASKYDLERLLVFDDVDTNSKMGRVDIPEPKNIVNGVEFIDPNTDPGTQA